MSVLEEVMTPQCALGRLHVSRQDADQIKRDGWLEQGILVVSATDSRLNWIEQEQIKQIGEKLYGARSSD